MKKIEIKLESDKPNLLRYAPIVLFLDQLDIEKEIEHIRNIIGTHNTKVPTSDFESHMNKFTYELSLDERQKFASMLERADHLKWPSRVMTSDDENEFEYLNKEITLWNDPVYTFKILVDRVLENWKIGEELREVLMKAIICNEVREEDLEVDIILGRTETIFRDRDWYWNNRVVSNEERLGYQKIAMKLDGDKEKKGKVQLAIKAYKDRLQNFRDRYWKDHRVQT